MLHNGENGSSTSKLTAQDVKKVLFAYLQEGIMLLKKRRESGNIIVFVNYIEKHGSKALKEKFNLPLEQIKHGYTNSENFKPVTEYASCTVGGVAFTGAPELTYILCDNKNPTDFIHDLFFNEAIITVVDDMLVMNAAKYYAVLKTFQKFLIKEGEADKIFNRIFSLDEAKMLVSSFMPKMGNRTTCINSAGFTVPPNPISYFISPARGEVKVGNVMCYQNYPEFRVKNPFGLHYATVVLCISQDPAKYLNFYFDKVMTEEEILREHRSAYNAEKSRWMNEEWARKFSVTEEGYSKTPRRKKVSATTPPPPGFRNPEAYQFNPEKMLAFILMPEASSRKIATFFQIENKAVKEIREERLRSMLPPSGQFNPETLNVRLKPDEEVPAARQAIQEDNLKMLLGNKGITFKLALKFYQENDFPKAVEFFALSLGHSRSIDHYYARMHGKEVENGGKKKITLDYSNEMLKAQEQIAIACYNLSAALRESDKPHEALPYIEEACEICTGLEITEETLCVNLILNALGETQEECASRQYNPKLFTLPQTQNGVTEILPVEAPEEDESNSFQDSPVQSPPPPVPPFKFG